MTRLRYLSVALLFVAVVVATGVGAFGAVTADRNADVSTGDEGLIGVEPQDQTLDNGRHTVPILAVTNNYREEITVTVSVSGDDGKPPKFKSGVSETIDAGEEGTVSVEIVCSAVGGKSNDRSETWTVTVEATSPNGSLVVETTDDVEITCEGTNNGKGKTTSGGPTTTTP